MLEACAFSVPHKRLGEVVGAGVQVRQGSGLTGEALIAFLSGQIAPFKVPEHIWVRDSALPRVASDKLDRRTLRRECLASMPE